MMTDAQVAAQVCVSSVVPGTSSTAICSGLPVHRGRAHPLSHGEQVTRDDLRRIVMRPSKLPVNGRDWKGVIDHAFVDTGCGDAVQLFSHGE